MIIPPLGGDINLDTYVPVTKASGAFALNLQELHTTPPFPEHGILLQIRAIGLENLCYAGYSTALKII